MTANELNVSLFSKINSLPHFPRLDPIVVFVGNIQQKEAAIFLGAVFLYGVLSKKRPVWLGVLVLAAAFWFVNETVETVKPLLNWPRPYNALENVIVLGGRPKSSAFPSSNAALSSLLLTYLYLVTKKFPFLWAGILVLLGALRIYQGLHFPGDVLGGWVLGAGTACAAFLAYSALLKGISRKP